MRQFLVLLSGALLCSLAVAAPQHHPVRDYADFMARAIVADNEAVVLANFAPAMRKAYSDEKLLGPLRLSRATFGTISRYEFRNSTIGGQIVGGRTIRTAICWYAAVTPKYPRGLFLTVSVAYANHRHYLAAFSVTHFVGDRVPKGLQQHASRSAAREP